jgi:hypothetical protein
MLQPAPPDAIGITDRVSGAMALRGGDRALPGLPDLDDNDIGGLNSAIMQPVSRACLHQGPVSGRLEYAARTRGHDDLSPRVQRLNHDNR